MQIKDFIKAKQNSQKLTPEDINYFIQNLNNFSQEEITKWLKAVKVNGLDETETSVLTLAMANSGKILSWNGLEPVMDKHSTGGIGDKITLLFVPLIAACGINIPKLSGRSLGISGGTIDKLESISGFRTNLSVGEIKEQVRKIGLAVSGAGSDLSPADKKLYAIRDVTGTVDSIPLIASSVMSKKIACGADNIILDVKYGSGAFMKNIHDAELLARSMVNIGRNLNKRIKAVITNMDEPLGYKIGNSLEIKEVLEVLSGKEVSDLVEITLCLAREAMSMFEKSESEESLRRTLLGGRALSKFELMVRAQSGNLSSGLAKAKHIEVVKCEQESYIHKINAELIGEAVFSLGAGRKNVGESIDCSVGVVLLKKHGEMVKLGESLLEIHAKNKEDAGNAKKKILSGIVFGQGPPPKLKLIYEVIT